MKKRWFILCCLFLTLTSSFSQEKTGDKQIDSLVILLSKTKIDTARVYILNKIAEKYRDLDPKQGISYSNRSILLSKKIKWNDGIALSLKNLGENYIAIGDIENADKYINQALPIAESKLNKCFIYRTKGKIHSLKSNYPKSLEYYFKALKICEDINNEKEETKTYECIGDAYDNIKDTKNALFFLNKSLAISLKLNLKLETSRSLELIGSVYFGQEKYSHALIKFYQSLNIAKKLNDKKSIVSNNIKIAKVLIAKEKFDDALKFVLIAKKKAEEIQNHRNITNCKLVEAQVYLFQYNKDTTNLKNRNLLKKSELLFLESIEDFKQSSDSINITFCKHALAELYLFTKNYKKSAYAALEYADLKDFIYTEKSKETIKNLEDQRTIELKNKQIEINKITLENQQKQKWFYVAGICFLCIAGGLLFYQSLNRKKTNQKLQLLNAELDQANKTKIQFLSILNHDLRSPVYNFIHFMQLQKDSPELLDKETKIEIETKTISSAENLLASMEDLLLWSKGQMNNFKPEPKIVALQSLFDDTKSHFASEEKTEILFENPDNLQIMTDENFLKTIIRNLTGNAIKAISNAENSKIIWKAYQEKNENYLSITDNGLGGNQDIFKVLYDPTQVVGIKSGLGLHLIRDLAKAIDCEIKVESKLNQGTTFILKFKN